MRRNDLRPDMWSSTIHTMEFDHTHNVRDPARVAPLERLFWTRSFTTWVFVFVFGFMAIRQ